MMRLTGELKRIRVELNDALKRLEACHHRPNRRENMSAIDDLKALGERLDAVTTQLPLTIEAAVTTAVNAAEADLTAEVTDLTAQVVALEAAANPPA